MLRNFKYMNFPGFRKALHFSEAEGEFKLFAKDNLKSQLRILKDMEELLHHLICESLKLAKMLQNSVKLSTVLNNTRSS